MSDDNNEDLIRRGDARDMCLEERGPKQMYFDSAHDEGYFDGAQACFDAIAAIPAADVSALIADAREQGARMALEAAHDLVLQGSVWAQPNMPTTDEWRRGQYDARRSLDDAIRALGDDPAFIASVRAGG